MALSWRSKRLLLYGLAAALLVLGSDAMWSQGSLTLKGNSTIFLSKFCFTFDPQAPHILHAGALDVNVRLLAGPSSGQLPDSDLKLLVFDDEEGSYPGPSAAWDSMSCEQRARRARYTMDIDRLPSSWPEGQSLSAKITQKVRPRWFYFAVADCTNLRNDVRLEYAVHATNPHYGWGAEFGTDRRFLPILLAMLAFAYAVLFAAQLHANRTVAALARDDSPSNKATHPFVQILMAGVLLGLVDCVAFLAHLCAYATNGVGVPSFQFISQLLSVMTNFVLASLLLLVSQGKCISHVMSSGDALEMLRLLGPFLVACCFLEVWGEYSISRNYTTNYVYTTPMGWMLISIDLFLLGKYFFGLRSTYHAEVSRDVADFYRRWGTVYGLWFTVLPVTALLAQLLLAPYAWLLVCTGAKKGVSALLYAALVAGLWPGNTRTYFTKLEMPEVLSLLGASMDIESLPSGSSSSTSLPWDTESLPSGSSSCASPTPTDLYAGFDLNRDCMSATRSVPLGPRGGQIVKNSARRMSLP